MIKVLKNKEDKIDKDKGIFVIEPRDSPFAMVFRTPTYCTTTDNTTTGNRVVTSWRMATYNVGDVGHD